MFTIGDFARHGRVSVRMLRHYDAIGLIRPAHVDPPTGYRFYEANQLAQLNRIVALKDLGFTLAQVSAIIDEQVSAEQLRGMLRLRHAELQAEIAAGTARLTGVAARLRIIESEGHMPTTDVVVKRIPAVRVAELTAIAAGYEPEDISPVIQPLYDDLMARLSQAELTPVGPPIAYYEDSPAGDGSVVVHATITVDAAPDPAHGFAIVDLPELPNAATIVHRGSMDDVVPTGQALAQWIDANGYRSLGYARELYLECPPGDFDGWVTELQEPITAV
jgi:DNA-binding transcriptional MerR regulator